MYSTGLIRLKSSKNSKTIIKKFKKKTNRDFPKEILKRAVEDVLNGVGNIRVIVFRRNMTKSGLYNYVWKAKKAGLDNIHFKSKFKTSIFS